MDMYSSVVWPQMWLITITVFLFCYNYFAKESWKRLPPGPLTLPLIGSLPFLGLDIREPLRKMAAKYGDVYTIYLGSRRVVVLNGYDVIKEAFVKNGNVFSGRAPVFFVTLVTEGYGKACTQSRAYLLVCVCVCVHVSNLLEKFLYSGQYFLHEV